MLLLLASLHAFAADGTHVLVRRDAKLCEKPSEQGSCFTVGRLAEPSSPWRDPFVATPVEEKGDWLLIDTTSAPSGTCMAGPPLPRGTQVRVWVMKTTLVPATVRPLEWKGEAARVGIAAGVPVGVPYNGKQGVAAHPFLGTLNVPDGATDVRWSPALPSVAPPEGAASLNSNAGVPVDLGKDGNGSILPGFNHGVLEAEPGWFTVHSPCAVVAVPSALASHADVKPLEAPPAEAAAPEGDVVKLASGTALLWENGKPLGTTWAEVVVPKASFATKGKVSCAAVLLEGEKSRSVTLCVDKALVGG